MGPKQLLNSIKDNNNAKSIKISKVSFETAWQPFAFATGAADLRSAM